MKQLSRDEMKKVIGGNESWHPPMVYCNDGYSIASGNGCSNSVGVCNAHGGFRVCEEGYYA